MITHRSRSRGIALLTVLLVVSIASIIGVALIKRQWVDIRKTENTLRMNQSWLYAQGIEAWALGRLQADLKQTPTKTDSEHDIWNQPIAPTQVDGGQLSAVISDYQGRFNINSLVSTSDNPEIFQRRFEKLLMVLDLPQELVYPILDWLDSDSETRYPNGVEENHYMAKDPPYRPANQAMSDVSELRLIEGITDEIYNTLVPHISALPKTSSGKTPGININTASETVLRSIHVDLELEDVQSILETRAEEPFENVAAFLDHVALSGRDPAVVDTGLTESSKYFEVNSDVQIGQLKLQYGSIIFRQDQDTIRVIQRFKRGGF